MYFVVTFHILGHSVSIRIQKLKETATLPSDGFFELLKLI